MRLFEFEQRWARAAFDAVFPEGSALPHGIARMVPERDLVAIVAACPFEQAVGLRLSLWLVALAPLWILRRLTTMPSLASDERQRVFTTLLGSSVYVVRQLAVAFKATAALLYAQSPAIRAAMLEASDDVAPHLAIGAFVPPPLESGFVVVRTRKAGAAAGMAKAKTGGGVRAA